jgi:thioredoxin 1
MGKPIEVTDQNFDEIISNNSKVVVDCWAAWCGPCRMIAPIVEEMAEEHPEVTFGKLNVDKNRKTPMKYGIMSIPTLLYFKDGKLVDKTLGALPKAVLKTRVAKLL